MDSRWDAIRSEATVHFQGLHHPRSQYFDCPWSNPGDSDKGLSMMFQQALLSPAPLQGNPSWKMIENVIK
jgi:hypothetical protein